MAFDLSTVSWRPILRWTGGEDDPASDPRAFMSDATAAADMIMLLGRIAAGKWLD